MRRFVDEEWCRKGKKMDDAKRLLKNGNQWRRIIVCGSRDVMVAQVAPCIRDDLDRLFISTRPPRKSLTLDFDDLPLKRLGRD